MNILAATRVDGTPLHFPKIDLISVFPEIFLAIAALLLLLLSSLTREKAGAALYSIYTAAVGTLATISTYWLWHHLDAPNDKGPRSAFAGRNRLRQVLGFLCARDRLCLGHDGTCVRELGSKNAI